MSSLKDLKERVYEANMELPRRGLVLYTFGNVSGIDRARGMVAIKPSGVSYDELTAEMIVVVDLENRPVEGSMRPSSDTKTHTHLYRAYPELGGVVHTHSTHATAWAQAGRDLPCLGTTHADYLAGPVPCTAVLRDEQIQGDYEEETGVQIVERLRGLSPAEVQMVLVAGHGPFTWGATPEKAVFNSVVLEELARMAWITLGIDPLAQPLKATLIEKHYRRKHGTQAYYGQA